MSAYPMTEGPHTFLNFVSDTKAWVLVDTGIEMQGQISTYADGNMIWNLTKDPKSGLWTITNLKTQRPLNLDTLGSGTTQKDYTETNDWQILPFTGPPELLHLAPDSGYCCYNLRVSLNNSGTEFSLTMPANQSGTTDPQTLLSPILYNTSILPGENSYQTNYPWYLAPARVN